MSGALGGILLLSEQRAACRRLPNCFCHARRRRRWAARARAQGEGERGAASGAVEGRGAELRCSPSPSVL